MMLITGATGTVGRELSAYLGAQGVKHRVMTRDPQKAKAMIELTGEFKKGYARS
jgi:uncharacterized protein YbjT (DUF2867 family)